MYNEYDEYYDDYEFFGEDYTDAADVWYVEVEDIDPELLNEDVPW